MYMIAHNLKVALRNLMKYKLQTTISVLSIAIGIVTLAFAHATVANIRFPAIYSQHYYSRTSVVSLVATGRDEAPPDSADRYKRPASFTPDIIRALKRDGGLRSIERMALTNDIVFTNVVEFHLSDSTARRASMNYTNIDPDYFNLAGVRSAITGKPIKRLAPGEAVISRRNVATMFGDANPVGAVCYQTNEMRPLPLTIVDVFEDLSVHEATLSNNVVYHSLGELDGDLFGAHVFVNDRDVFYSTKALMLRCEGYTEHQMLDELNTRLKSLGYAAKVSPAVSGEAIQSIIVTQTLVHLIGSLILIAAIIGFLRMEVQLFWMRRREVTLRITHGAKLRQLFGLLFTEVAIVVLLSTTTAMLSALWVENILTTRFASILRDMDFLSLNIVPSSLSIGGLLLAVCALIIWLTVVRMRQTAHGLVTHMRSSRTHLFRNVMLGLQIAISTVFVCATFTIVRWSSLVLRPFHIPDDTAFYEECVYLSANDAQFEIKSLKEEIGRLQSLEKMLPHDVYFPTLPEITNNADAMAAFQNQDYQPILCTADTTIISFYDLPVKWLDKKACAGPCLLVNDSVYAKMRSVGVAQKGTLTLQCYGPIEEDLTLPIAGTISYVPYEYRQLSIAISPTITEALVTDFVLVPRKGQYDRLIRETNDVIRQIVPTIVQPMTHNFHDYRSVALTTANAMRFASIILGIVSLIICAMSIYSTIALDTRSRQKEVAIRKVCGAKSRDIYRLFGRIYLLIVALSLVIALPVATLFHSMMFAEDMMTRQAWESADTSPLIPCLMGALVVIALIALIVVWHIRIILRTNPSEIIVKE